MKTTKTSVVTKSVLALAAVASLNAFAGTKPAPAACAACEQAPFSGILSADYASTFLFRGAAIGDNVLTTGLSVSVPLGEGFSLGLGSTVARGLSANGGRNGTPGNFSWNTYSLGLSYEVGAVKLGLVFNQYDNLNGGIYRTNFRSGRPASLNDSFNEIGLTVQASAGVVDVGAAVYRDFDNDSVYAQVSVGTSIEVTSAIKLVPSVVAGYGLSDHYATATGGSSNTGDDGLTHVATSLAVPIKVTKNSTLTPYASWNVTGDQRSYNASNSQVITGLKFSVGF
jgi:hypothetical protein